MNIDLTPIFQAIIALLAALVTYKLIPWLKARNELADQEKAQARWNLLTATTKALVFAAEQIYGAGMGHEKLEYVKQELERRGFTVDVSAIEGAVAEYLNYAPEASLIVEEDYPPDEADHENTDD